MSTRDQTTANQERELRQWSARLGLDVVAVYAETVSGARGDRTALADVLACAHRREFNELLICALDRLSREGIRKPRAVDVEEVRRRRAAGQGWRRIARALKIPLTTLRRKVTSAKSALPG